MRDKRLTLDTNILVYAVDISAGEKHEIAKEIVKKSMDVDCVLTVQALSEFYSVSTRKGHAKHEEAREFIDDWSQFFPIIGTNGSILMKALNAVQNHGFSFWDAMIWAAAKEAGCDILLTEDFQADRTIEGILFQNPFSHAFAKENRLDIIFND